MTRWDSRSKMEQRNTKEGNKIEKHQTRGWLSWLSLTGLFGATLAIFGTNLISQQIRTPELTDYSLRTELILSTTPLIDGHNDLPYLLRLELQNKIYDNTSFTFRDGQSQPTLGDASE